MISKDGSLDEHADGTHPVPGLPGPDMIRSSFFSTDLVCSRTQACHSGQILRQLQDPMEQPHGRKLAIQGLPLGSVVCFEASPSSTVDAFRSIGGRVSLSTGTCVHIRSIRIPGRQIASNGFANNYLRETTEQRASLVSRCTSYELRQKISDEPLQL
ncbi:uncharacterized protein BDV17DRAFT_38461 [Aspergillus undulatus]|uniref:uncharacterized protein n=1 Tax=Aspergillus undulatus TaxID=1810928 RepID=UPI003CCCF33B